MSPIDVLSRSPAMWNRDGFVVESDEAVAQILDRGTLDDWRALDALARNSASLRSRIVGLVAHVPMYLPHFWLVAMRSLGEQVDLSAVAPNDGMQE